MLDYNINLFFFNLSNELIFILLLMYKILLGYTLYKVEGD